MAAPKSTVKSAARADRARALIADLPRDPVSGRIQKRAASGANPPAGGPPAGSPPDLQPAGGPAAALPFGQAGRGLRRFRRRRSE
jgi:hypothetical protein